MRALLLSIALAACAQPAGGPLKHTFDNTKLAAVPLEQKQPVVEAQQQHEVALLARANAKSSYSDSEIEQDTAEFQASKAIVVSHVVAARRPEAKLAPASADLAALARRTADAKVDYMRARRAWLAKLASSSLYVVYAAQAKLELERAKVAMANRVTTADLDVAAFEKQAAARGDAAKLATEESETARKGAEAKLVEWSELEKQYLEKSNVSGPLESARYAKRTMVAAPPEPAKPELVPAAMPAETKPTEPLAPMQQP